MPAERQILFGKGTANGFGDNTISTTKYTLLTFVPLNLIVQLSKTANQYFVLISIMQCFDAITITGGVPTNLPPLMMIIFFSMLKDAYEDYARYKRDEEENTRKTLSFKDGRPVEVEWGAV